MEQLSLSGVGSSTPILVSEIIDLGKKYKFDLLHARLTKQVPTPYGSTINFISINNIIRFEADPTSFATDLYQRFKESGVFAIEKNIRVKNPATKGTKQVKIGLKLPRFDFRPTFTITPTEVQIQGEIAEFKPLGRELISMGERVGKENLQKFTREIVKEPEVGEILSKVEDVVDKWELDRHPFKQIFTSCKIGPDNEYQNSIEMECRKDLALYGFPYEKEEYRNGKKSTIYATPSELRYANKLNYLQDKISEWHPESTVFGNWDKEYPFAFRCRRWSDGDKCDFHIGMTKDEFHTHFPENSAIAGSVKYPEYYTDKNKHLTFETRAENLENIIGIISKLP